MSLYKRNGVALNLLSHNQIYPSLPPSSLPSIHGKRKNDINDK